MLIIWKSCDHLALGYLLIKFSGRLWFCVFRIDIGEYDANFENKNIFWDIYFKCQEHDYIFQLLEYFTRIFERFPLYFAQM